ncbi:MAG: MFS transporter [Frankiaceae bacterium]|nr:MFS transporter [Frankiaceae bacterium]
MAFHGGVLRTPGVGRLALLELISGTGDWLLIIGLPIYLYALTHSTLTAATAMLVELVASLAVGQFSGLLVDRFRRRPLMALTNAAQGLALLPLTAVHGRHDIAIVYVVGAVEAALSTITGPAGQALLPTLVGTEELVSANTLIGVAADVAKLVGASAAGAALSLHGLPGLVIVDAATFAVAVALLAVRFPGREPVRTDPTTLQAPWRAWTDGLRVARRTRDVASSLVLVVLNQLAQGIALALIVAFVVTDLRQRSADVGVFRGFQVLGTLPTGLLLAAYGRRIAPETLLKASLLSAAFIEFLMWNGPTVTTWFGYYLILEVLLGLPGMAGFVAFISILQKATPDSHRGRVFALTGAASNAALIVSVELGGALGEHFDPRFLLNITVAFEFAAGVGALFLFRTRRAMPAAAPDSGR